MERPRVLLGDLGGRLTIELSKPAEPIGKLQNLAAPPQAEIVSLKIRVYRFVAGDLVDLTEDELDAVAWPESNITLASSVARDIPPVRHEREGGFRVRDLIAAIEETEMLVRAKSEWFDGVDVHHVFFEGLVQEDGGYFSSQWGS